MPGPNQSAGDEKINPKIAELIENLSEERQLILLKKLLNTNIAELLLKKISEISANEQALLLEQLQANFTTPVSAEETEISLRGNKRKSCMINANYEVDGHTHRGFILDISPAGAFIETGESFLTGQQIQLAFSLPTNPKQLTVHGKILWKGLLGIGVQFDKLGLEQQNIITNFIEARE